MQLPVRMLVQHSGRVTVIDALGVIVTLIQEHENNYEAAVKLVQELNAPAAPLEDKIDA